MEEDEIKAALSVMEKDAGMHTKSSYAANATLWPKNSMTFTEKHLAYIKAHPTLNPKHYLSNLRLKITKR